ncbi:carboxymethylenebutenolidase [Azospirillum cavernae]|uniref:Carboxymethylenebutenolidase n=1 Tax=Azospirillum cavernae TaxID=2320860 RepID=A0A418VPF6_9PROT|nr:dienelactone hydrolase family protein [Azospirillum cavernae]RJF78137.1 carboxymethylenebutenolidase [Azospirillum cavernae]
MATRLSPRRLIAGAVFTLAAFGAAFAPAAAQERAAIANRVELHSIPSLTLSDGQFLTGDSAGAVPVTVTGEFRVAQGEGRLPVVVLMHGSGGIGPNIEMWARLLNAQGVSTFAIDGFTGRGLVSTSADQAKLGRLNLILDIYRSLEILAKHPRVDPQRVVLMGFSRGGQAAFYASLARFHALWNRSGAEFAGYIPFYPDCATRYIDDLKPVARPIHLIHGAADDYNPLRTCAAQVERLQKAGAAVTLTSYPDAHHGFDSPLSDGPMVAATAQTVRDCSIEERAPGQLINAATNAPFAYTDACVQKGPQVGGNPEARAAAQKTVVDLILSLVKKG